MPSRLFHWIVVACMLAFASTATTAIAEVRDMDKIMDKVTELPGDGPWQRFIVKYRADSEPGRDPQMVQARLERAASGSGVAGADGEAGLRLAWQRRLGVGADVFQADRPLQREQARRLLETFAADPDVEYVEADAVMQAGPVPIMPQRPL